MRMSEIFGTTLREAPAHASSAGAALLARGGFIRDQGSQRTWLPLGARVLTRIEKRVQQELRSLGAQEIILPAVPTSSPADFRALTALVRTEVRSWRQLPRILVVRGASIPAGGSSRAFVLEPDPEALRARLAALEEALRRIGSACELMPQVVEAAAGRAFVAPSEAGEAELARCRVCDYAALRDEARFARAPAEAEDLLPIRKVATPGCASIDELARFLGVGAEKTAKAVFLVADEEQLVFAVVRGDREVSAAKLRSALRARVLRPARDDEIRAVGAVPGFASPIGLSRAALVVADPEAAESPNLAAGANEEGFHLLNTNVPRDYAPTLVQDIAALPPQAACVRCDSPLASGRGFSLGTLRVLAALPGAADTPQYHDAEGAARPVQVAELELSPDRILAATAEAHRDERGLVWPTAIAPFDAHVVSLGGPGTDALAAAERLCAELEARGAQVLLEDREESPGVKFADADLVGVPVRITVSARSLAAGGVEVKRRGPPEKRVMDAARAVSEVLAAAAGR